MKDAKSEIDWKIGNYQVYSVQSGRWRQNSYIIQHCPSSELLLVDPGGEEDQLIEIIKNVGGNLRLILLTHGHYDHVGALNKICKQFSLPFFIHSGDKRLLKQAQLYGVSFEKRDIQVPKDHRFLETEKLRWKGDPIQFLHTPGHTHGGVCLYWEGIAFTGDTLLHQKVVRADLPGADSELLAESITSLLQVLPQDTLIFPGHGRPWAVNDARHWWKENSNNPPEYIEGN
jgi:glyoxylase-like metal-dependent hydrolase (beta-lactamase superfamily II)